MDAARRGSHTHSSNWLADIPVLGPEDIAIDQGAGVAYISSQDRLASEWLFPGVLGQRAVDWTQRGRLYRADLQRGLAAKEMEVRLPQDGDFHPVGIDVFTKPSGERRLFVVNWRSASEFSIEVFDVDGDHLSLAETARSSDLTCPNEIVAIDEERFFVSNSLSLPPMLQGLEKACCLPTGNVFFHDLNVYAARIWKRIAYGIPYANGLAVNSEWLFVASSLSQRLLAFAWNPAKPWELLSNPKTLLLNFMPDNLGWEDEKRDTLWVAGSEFLRSIPYTLLLSATAPSHVARVRLADPAAKNPFKDVTPEPVYDNDGTEIAQCSVAACYEANGERRFMVGSCFDHHVSAFGSAA